MPIEIGRRSDGTGYFAGRLAEFAYFGRALSAGDVATLYAAGHRPAQ